MSDVWDVFAFGCHALTSYTPLHPEGMFGSVLALKRCFIFDLSWPFVRCQMLNLRFVIDLSVGDVIDLL